MKEAVREPRFVVFRSNPEQFVRILDSHPDSPVKFSPLVHREQHVQDTRMIPLVMTVDSELLAAGGVSCHEDRGEVWIWIVHKKRAAAFLRPFLESCQRALQSLKESLGVPLRCIVSEDGPERNFKFARAVGFLPTGRKLFAGEGVPCVELELS